MGKLKNLIFKITPKKLAIYLVLAPLILFLVHTIFTIALRNISETTTITATATHMLLGTLFLILFLIISLWLFWLKSTVYSIEKTKLGLTLRWFKMAFIAVLIFILFNFVTSIIENLEATYLWREDYMYLIYSSSEFINFAGIMIAYPIVCHYAARAFYVKKNDQSATFVNSLAFTLILIFGTVLAIPFAHKYFSTKKGKNSEIIVIYAIAFGVVVILFIIGIMAAIAGWV